VIGSVLDKYEVLEKVGEGGMATVYRGRHATLNRDVAIKVLHPHLSSSTRNRKRFAREARAIEHLRHANILEIFDYSGTDAGECYIVTEFVMGDTLSALLWRRGRLPPEVAASIALDLARALSYAHREGILHRDLKPDNVMIRFDGTVKLMDFGIARFLDESQVTMTGALVGSPAYMSPEQAKEGKLDVRSDLFSLGTLLFQTTTGQLPFSGSNPSVILKNIVEGNRPAVVELVPTIAPALADVIERLMATQREDRFDSAEALVHALEGVLAESGIDRSRAEWTLSAYLEAPEAWEQRLEAHLRTFLLASGKRLLEGGDHLAALRLFNRLLSMDAENAEVLALVGQLHGAVRPARRVGLLLGVATTAVLVCALLAAWLASPRRPAAAIAAPQPEVPEVVASVPAPVAPAAPLPAAPQPPAPVPMPAAAPLTDPPIRRVSPPEPEPPPPVEAPVAELPGTLTIVTGVPADVYNGTKKIGQAGRKIELLGSYSLTVKSDLFLPAQVDVVVGSQETRQVDVALQARPRTVYLQGFEEACLVVLDGLPRGTVASTGGRVPVERPEIGAKLVVDCGATDHTFTIQPADFYLGDKTVRPR